MGKINTLLQILTLFLCIGLVLLVVDLTKSVDVLKQENISLRQGLSELSAQIEYRYSNPVAKTPSSASKPSTSSAKTSSTTSRPSSTVAPSASPQASSPTPSTTRTVAKRISVSASYRMEDRYVSYKVTLPDYIGKEEGIVVVNIDITKLGSVSRATIGSATTITDEDVLEAAKKAALKTDFNYISTAPDSQSGTITYKYVAQ